MTIHKQYRLADSTVIEPLVHKWHAWSHVLSPLTAGFHLLNYQCNTMKSYIDDPESHVRACSDPTLKGGPFINTPVDRAEEIRRLLDDTIANLGRNMELATAVVTYYNKLVDEAKGQSIEPFYESLPRELQGYVEMVYDYYNRPTLRILEGLLYESPYYDDSLQSLRLFRLEEDAGRDFFMSTPRLHKEGEINWPTPFAADRVDSLFRLEREFRPLGYIKDLLGLESVSETTFEKLFTQNAVAPKAELDRSLLRLRYYGHATVLMEWNGIAILTDPCVSALPHGGGIGRYSYNDLPDHIDFALVTHNHHDHLVFETLLRLRNRIGCLVVPKTNGLLYGDTSLRLMARKLGVRNCLEFDLLDSVEFPGGEIIGVPFLGEHSDIAHSKISYVVRAGNERILFAADSACLDEGIYRNLRRIIGPIQTVFLGMECVGAPLTWHCGSLLPKLPDYHHDQSRRSHGCDAAGGLRLLEILEAKRFYNYAMGLEPWMEFLLGLGLTEASTQIRQSNQLLRKARGRGLLAAERLFAKRDIYLPNEPATRRKHKPLTGHGADEWPGDQQDRGEPALWFLMASDPDTLFSISSALAQVRGRLNMNALDCALRMVVSSDRVFASALRKLNGTPTRNGKLSCHMRLKVADLTGLGSEDIADAVCASLLDDQGRHSGHKARLLPSVCLISLSAENHYVVVTSHRLVCDSWALDRLLKEVAEVYAELVTDAARRPVRPSPHSRAGGGSFDGEDGRGALVIFSNPGDKKYCVDPVRITGPLLESAKRLAADTKCDLWLILLAAFQVMVQAIESGEEVDVRAIVENADNQPPGGCLFSALRLVTDVSGSLSFARLAERLWEVAKRAAEKQKVIDEAAVAQLRREFDFDGEAILRPVFLIKRKFQAELRLPNSEWSFLDVLPARTDSGLMLCLYQDAAGVSGVLRHDENLLKSGTVADLGNQYEAILREVALNPGRPFYDLCGLGKAPDGGAGIEGVDLNVQFDFFP